MDNISVLRPNLPKFLISGQDLQFQISYLWLTNLTFSDSQNSYHWEYISFLGLNFPRMRGMILALMSNICYLAEVLIFLVVTACYLLVTARYCSLLGGYWWLMLVTAPYCSFSLLLWTSRSIAVKCFYICAEHFEENWFERDLKVGKIQSLEGLSWSNKILRKKFQIFEKILFWSN